MIRSDETAKEFRENVLKKVDIVRLQDFKAKYKTPAELPDIGGPITNAKLDLVDVFFFR